MANANLSKARRNKYDEFYTSLADVTKELDNYNFAGKVVYCNCDDFRSSNFWTYFTANFERLGLSKVISTGYDLEGGTYASFDGTNLVHKRLNGNGSFDSEECIDILKSIDIVCTNPPFSLIGKFLDVIKDVDYLFIGHATTIARPEYIERVVNGTDRLGVNNGTKLYEVPVDYHLSKFEVNGKYYAKLGSTYWFTNLPVGIPKGLENSNVNKFAFKDLYCFDNYKDIINVDRVKDIPANYTGKIGVPISFLTKWDESKFRINGLLNNPVVHGLNKFARIEIERK